MKKNIFRKILTFFCVLVIGAGFVSDVGTSVVYASGTTEIAQNQQDKKKKKKKKKAIGKAKAKKIAFKDAGIKGKNVKKVKGLKVKEYKSDGYYMVNFTYKKVSYQYMIDRLTGQILDQEDDSGDDEDYDYDDEDYDYDDDEDEE